MNFADLDPSVQKQLIAAFLQMSKTKDTPENQNRAQQALASNPELLKQVAQQAGIDLGDEANEDPAEEASETPDQEAAEEDDEGDSPAGLTKKKLGM